MKKNNKLYRIISICLLLCFVFAFSCSAASPDFYHFLSTPSAAGDDFTNHLRFALTSSVDLDFVGPFLVTSWSPWINFTLNYFSDFIATYNLQDVVRFDYPSSNLAFSDSTFGKYLNGSFFNDSNMQNYTNQVSLVRSNYADFVRYFNFCCNALSGFYLGQNQVIGFTYSKNFVPLMRELFIQYFYDFYIGEDSLQPFYLGNFDDWFNSSIFSQYSDLTSENYKDVSYAMVQVNVYNSPNFISFYYTGEFNIYSGMKYIFNPDTWSFFPENISSMLFRYFSAIIGVCVMLSVPALLGKVLVSFG